MSYFTIIKTAWQYRAVIGYATILLLSIYGLWYIYDEGKEEQKRKDRDNAISDYIAGTGKSHTIGLDLETGLNEYKKKAQELNKEAINANYNDIARISSDSMHRAAKRIAAGESARQRIN